MAPGRTEERKCTGGSVFLGRQGGWIHPEGPMTDARDPWPCRGARGWLRYRVFVYFVLGLAAVDVVIAACAGVWRAYNPNFYLGRLETCRRQPWDLVIVGGSPAM